ncbi:c-type cytochrome [Hymenobacter lapidiphilus]|uniref:Cytochrome c n=1 Tax=Hymenobacter lapidiphilus TaxID=2608003 RepID=A0A7Y7U6D6_9BACT|nr:cytochrome c [Hymenobacter lapidiphilus]NVO32398.1 cytochrome c [Hymenobacter lapidiphilus]
MLSVSSVITRPAVLLVAALLLNACSPAADASETDATKSLPPIPPTAAATETPAGADAAVLAAGQALFAQNCAVCHGADGKLGVNGARDLTKSNLNAAGRTYMVVNGSVSGVMPGFKDQLTDEQITQVVAYSLTLK